MRYTKKIWAGDVYEVEEYYSARNRGKRYPRGKNENETCEKQEERNLKNAKKRLARKINTNFGRGDLFVTLTHKEAVTVKEGRHQLKNFIRRLKRWRKKNGLEELKYIAVTEAESKRTHQHIIMNGMENGLQVLEEIWGKGRVMVSGLEPGGDYTGLANYITKEDGKDGMKRWSCSRNLADPIEKVTRSDGEKPKKRLQVPKGYIEVERYEVYSEEIGSMRYLKAVKIGGADYGEGRKNE